MKRANASQTREATLLETRKRKPRWRRHLRIKRRGDARHAGERDTRWGGERGGVSEEGWREGSVGDVRAEERAEALKTKQVFIAN